MSDEEFAQRAAELLAKLEYDPDGIPEVYPSQIEVIDLLNQRLS